MIRAALLASSALVFMIDSKSHRRFEKITRIATVALTFDPCSCHMKMLAHILPSYSKQTWRRCMRAHIVVVTWLVQLRQ
jgi:hypothetical protein